MSFINKNIWQDLAELQPKIYFQACQIFSSFQQWICRGPTNDFMSSNNLGICTPNLGKSKFKIGFKAIPNCCPLWHFFHANFGLQGYFSASNGLIPKQKLPRYLWQKQLDMAHKI